jgi:dihydrofolate reductase
MRELTYYIASSLDGYIASPDGDFSAFPVEGDHMAALMTEFADTIPTHVQRLVGIEADRSRFDTVVMGWETYTPALREGIDSPYAHLRQVVATRQLRSVPDGIETTGDPVTTVRALKREPGAGIYLAGGGALAGALIGEIDRLIVKRYPLLLGDGIPMFRGLGYAPLPFARVSSRPFESGMVLDEYVRA